jgi:hypothetical protein
LLWSGGSAVGIRTSQDSRFISLKGRYLSLLLVVQFGHGDPISPHFIVHRGLFHQWKGGRDVKLTIGLIQY